MTSYHKTILIVEDEEQDQVLIHTAFRENGVTNPIHFVNNAVEAIKYLMGEGNTLTERSSHFRLLL